jgi:hypothetical protein
MHAALPVLHFLNVVENGSLRGKRDDGPNIDTELVGIPGGQFGHCSLQHRQDVVGDLVLQTQKAERGTTLAGRVEC